MHRTKVTAVITIVLKKSLVMLNIFIGSTSNTLLHGEGVPTEIKSDQSTNATPIAYDPSTAAHGPDINPFRSILCSTHSTQRRTSPEKRKRTISREASTSVPTSAPSRKRRRTSTPQDVHQMRTSTFAPTDTQSTADHGEAVPSMAMQVFQQSYPTTPGWEQGRLSPSIYAAPQPVLPMPRESHHLAPLSASSQPSSSPTTYRIKTPQLPSQLESPGQFSPTITTPLLQRQRRRFVTLGEWKPAC